MSKFEAMVQAQALKGMRGDARSAGMMINVMTRAGLLGDPDTETGIAAVQRGTPAAGLRLGDALFENLDPSLLSNDEMIELSRLAEVIDLGGDVTALSTGDFERLKQIINKGRGKDITAPNGEHYE